MLGISPSLSAENSFIYSARLEGITVKFAWGWRRAYSEVCNIWEFINGKVVSCLVWSVLVRVYM